MSQYTDDLVGYTVWTPNRHVLVFRRNYADRSFVRTRVFNRHRQKDLWYPSPRSFHVNQDCAEELGETVIAAARGEQLYEPEWWEEFEAQYNAGGRDHTAKWKRERRQGT